MGEDIGRLTAWNKEVLGNFPETKLLALPVIVLAFSALSVLFFSFHFSNASFSEAFIASPLLAPATDCYCSSATYCHLLPPTASDLYMFRKSILHKKNFASVVVSTPSRLFSGLSTRSKASQFESLGKPLLHFFMVWEKEGTAEVFL